MSSSSESPQSVSSDPLRRHSSTTSTTNSHISSANSKVSLSAAAVVPGSGSTAFGIDGDINRKPIRRRKHKNSKLGCATCKLRRVKCTEDLPECSNCVKHKVKCDYLDYSEEQLDAIRQAKLTNQFDELSTKVPRSPSKKKDSPVSKHHSTSSTISDTSTANSSMTRIKEDFGIEDEELELLDDDDDDEEEEELDEDEDEDEESGKDDDDNVGILGKDDPEDVSIANNLQSIGISRSSSFPTRANVRRTSRHNQRLKNTNTAKLFAKHPSHNQILDFQSNYITQDFNNILIPTADGDKSQQIIYPIYTIGSDQQQQQQQQDIQHPNTGQFPNQTHQYNQQTHYNAHIHHPHPPQHHPHHHQDQLLQHQHQQRVPPHLHSYHSESSLSHQDHQDRDEDMNQNFHSLENNLDSTINYNTFEDMDFFGLSPSANQPQQQFDRNQLFNWNRESGPSSNADFASMDTSGETNNQLFVGNTPNSNPTPAFMKSPTGFQQFPSEEQYQNQPSFHQSFEQQQQQQQQQQQRVFEQQQQQQTLFNMQPVPGFFQQQQQQQQDLSQPSPFPQRSPSAINTGYSGGNVGINSLPGAILLPDGGTKFSYKKYDNTRYDEILVNLLKELGPSIDNGTCPLPKIRNVYHVWLASFIYQSFTSELMFSCLVNLTTNFLISTVFNNYQSYKEYSDSLSIADLGHLNTTATPFIGSGVGGAGAFDNQGTQQPSPTDSKEEIEKLLDKTKLRNFALVKSIKHYAKVIKQLRDCLNTNDDPDLCAQVSYILSLMSIYDPESTLNSTNCFRDGLFSILNYNFNLLMKKNGYVPLIIWVHLNLMKNVMRAAYLPSYDPTFVYEFRTVLVQFGMILKPLKLYQDDSNTTLKFINSKYDDLINYVDDSLEKYFPVLLNNTDDIDIQQQVLYDMLYSWVRFFPSRLLVVNENSDPIEKILYLFYKTWRKALFTIFPQTKYFFLRDFDSPLMLDLFAINRDVDIFLEQLQHPHSICIPWEEYRPLITNLRSISSYLVRIITFLQVRLNLLYRSTVYEPISKKEFPIDDVKVWRDSIKNIKDIRYEFNKFTGLREIPIKSFLKNYIKLENYPRVVNAKSDKSFIRKDDGVGIDGISAQTPMTSLPSVVNTPVPTVEEMDIEVDLFSLQESGFLKGDFNIMKAA
ncbi:uncharacterized protein RJT21DRAFT_112844 [Scheffersomyces amazonensis]|uniref:uncharacterized protein n=1 Tax=Scheffersomyces amazonensis TaxID=1078765 RepID=UPI00315D4A5C